MAVNGLDVTGNLISLLIALMHKRPIANLMACSQWVIEVGLIGRIDWRPPDKRWWLGVGGDNCIYWSEELTFVDGSHYRPLREEKQMQNRLNLKRCHSLGHCVSNTDKTASAVGLQVVSGLESLVPSTCDCFSPPACLSLVMPRHCPLVAWHCYYHSALCLRLELHFAAGALEAWHWFWLGE